MQVEDFTNQATLQATMNDLQLGFFKWKMSKMMPKTLLGLWKRLRNTPLPRPCISSKTSTSLKRSLERRLLEAH